jgi:hypothetical protein
MKMREALAVKPLRQAGKVGAKGPKSQPGDIRGRPAAS